MVAVLAVLAIAVGTFAFREAVYVAAVFARRGTVESLWIFSSSWAAFAVLLILLATR